MPESPPVHHGKERLLTVDEVATWLRCKPGKVYRLAREEGLPFVKVSRRGKRILFKPSHVEAWLDANTETIDLTAQPPSPVPVIGGRRKKAERGSAPVVPVPGHEGVTTTRPKSRPVRIY